MKRYKVISQKDKFFSGKFDPVILEQVLNEHAAQGWKVVSMVTASREGVLLGGNKDELLVLLEMEVKAEASAPKKVGMADDGTYHL